MYDYVSIIYNNGNDNNNYNNDKNNNINNIDNDSNNKEASSLLLGTTITFMIW